MKNPKFLIFAIFALTLTFGAGSVFAQRSDRDNPIPLSTGEISGSLNDHKLETFYSFTAGPGEVTITLDVQAQRDSQGEISFDVLARNGSTSLACCYYAQGNGGGTGQETATFKLDKRQTVLLHTTNGPIGGGTFRFRISGASSFSGSTAGGNEGRGDNDGDDNGRGNRGEPVSVPSRGILHIRMKNGTVQDIDLGRVRDITVRP